MPPQVPSVLFSFIGAYGAGVLLTPFARWLAVRTGCVSRPQKDRWGRRVVPRLGGLPIGLAFLGAVSWASLHDPRMLGLLAATLLTLVVGIVDDFRCLPPNVKLTSQIMAGCLVVAFNIQVDLGSSWLSAPVTIGWLVLVMNAFNLMDNMDGLSAGIGAIASGFCVWHALGSGEHWVAAVAAASLVGSALGFLQYNLPPAKIFMGDSGSQILGLGLGTLSLMETWHQPARLLGLLALPTLLLAVPLFDTLFVTFQRILHGRHPFQGGTDHLSHRLGLLGLSPRRVVFLLYGLTGAFGMLSLFLTGQSPLAILATWLLALGILLMLGAYVAKVRVYTGPPPPPLEEKGTWIETMLLHKRRLVEAAVDFALICACYVLAHALRFEGNLTSDLEALVLRSLPWVIGIKMIGFLSCGIYRGIWRYTGMSDLLRIFKAVVLGSLLSALAVLYLWRFEGYSRAVFLIDAMLLFLAVSGARLLEPLLENWIRRSEGRTLAALIVGAGDTGELLMRQLHAEREGKCRVVGFLDDDPLKQGDQIHGIPILGTRRDLGRVVHTLGVSEIFIAMRQPPGELVQQIKGYCQENNLSWRLVGSLASGEPAPL